MEKLTIKLYDMANGNLLAIFEDDELRIEKGEYATIDYSDPKKEYKFRANVKVTWASEVQNNEQIALVKIDETTKIVEKNQDYIRLYQQITKNTENLIESMTDMEKMEEPIKLIKKAYKLIKEI